MYCVVPTVYGDIMLSRKVGEVIINQLEYLGFVLVWQFIICGKTWNYFNDRNIYLKTDDIVEIYIYISQ